MLSKFVKDPPTKEEALFLLKKVQNVDKFLELAKVASKVREDEVGEVFKFDGFIGAITSCDIDPPCKYCTRSAKGRVFKEPLTIEEVRLGAEVMAEAGVKRVEIGGGTQRNAGEKVIEAVRVIKEAAPNLEIWVNVGPALTKEDLIELKKLGVSEVCSSLETINPQIFAEIKPGDSLNARMKLAEEINRVGLGLTSVMMVGIASYEDYVEHIFWLRNFENLSHFPITGFNPIPRTAMENAKMPSSLEVAKVGAVARLILRDVDISFGGIMNDPRLLPLWIMSGANRAIHLGAHIDRSGSWHGNYPKEVIIQNYGKIEFRNMLPLTVRLVKSCGMEVDVEGYE